MNIYTKLSAWLGSLLPQALKSAVLLAMGAIAIGAHAVNLTPLPPYLTETKGAPMVMLNMSKDHQLFFKAYNEFSDLDGDGVIETQYKHRYKYYGYFDNQRCYNYSTTDHRYVPVTKTDAQGYCTNATAADNWNGNFMNWATMARIDVIRKIMYGGFRAQDTASAATPSVSLTVLERAHLPSDAHAFAKYYYGADINKLTPFSPPATNFTVSTPAGTASISTPQITLCNVSYGNGDAPASNTTDAPSILVAEGNHALWASGERWQCYWREAKNVSNGNNPAVSGFGASRISPRRTDAGEAGIENRAKALGTGYDAGTYTARVEVCKTGLPGGFTSDEDSRCKLYSRGNYKPVGLLQKYGEKNEAAFGLMTGSFDKNISGGVLRKNISSFVDEIDLDDGQFKNVDGIVRTLNKLKVTGYSYATGEYEGLVGGCGFQKIGLTDGECRSWGNPLGEMYLESLRYLAGASASSSFITASSPRDASAGLTVSAWADPFAASTVASFGDRACRRSNVINFNASVTSFDSNSWGGAPSISGLTTATVDLYTNQIGSAEGLYAAGKLWSVGRTGTNNNGFCSDKALTSSGTDSFANATGICPEAPTQFGGYKMAGAALYAHTTPIRTDITVAANNNRAFKVDTYSVALATGSPRIKIPVPGQAGKFVFLSPAYRLDVGGGGGGTLVDFRILYQTATKGKYLVNWEDSEQGGDFDQDVFGSIEYSVDTANRTISVTTVVIAEATNQPQGFGYAITGTNGKDGVHFHSSIEGFNYTDTRVITVTPTPTLNISGGCRNCQAGDPATTALYSMVGVAGESLKDPLWYAAKYGGFDRDKATAYTVGTALPIDAWDSKNADGSTGADGIPDNYFLAVDPAQLEKSLDQVFATILKSGGAAPAATSARTDVGGYAYQSTHSIKSASSDADADASGQLLRYGFQTNGDIAANFDWDAGVKLSVQNWDTGRNILSMTPAGAIPFRFASLSASQQGALLINPQNGVNQTTSGLGSNRLEWIRGSSASETTAGGLRRRPNTKLGAIINSTPWYVSAPSAGYSSSAYGGGYGTFVDTASATNVVFVAANDGMLHAIDGATGNELFAYVPLAMFITSTTAPYSKLSAMTDKNFVLNQGTGGITMDGSVMVADMKLGATPQWGSYLFGTFGRGAKGMYSLKVTNPQNVTEASATDLVKWEYSQLTGDPDLGYIIGRPTARRNGQPFQTGYMANGKWASIFGNGYNSTSGKPVLYIMFGEGPGAGTSTWVAGTHYVKLNTGAAGNVLDNGLSTPTAVDANNDGIIDIIYAGDLKGNVWKFDVSNSDTTQWGVATTGAVPLYQARTTIIGSTTIVVQPITTVVQPFPHPKGGYQLIVGTGQSLETNDYPMSAPYVNTIYGLHDRLGNTTTITVGVTDLVEKSATYVNNTRNIKDSTVDYSTQKGWYLRLPISSEGIVFNAIPDDFNRVFIASLAPDGATDGCRIDSISIDQTLNVISGNAFAGAVEGAPSVAGFTAAGVGRKNQFETARGSTSRRDIPPPSRESCSVASANCTCNPGSASECVKCDNYMSCNPSWEQTKNDTVCTVGSPDCICNSKNPTQCVVCTDLLACNPPWKYLAGDNLCVLKKLVQGGSGISVVERLGSCSTGRLTWREVLRNR